MSKRLASLGITTKANDDGSREPNVSGWMPSAQIYFSDPDGHSLEYITLLDEAPDPDFTGSWAQWRERN